MIGLAVLVIDASRFSNLHTALQKGADALALAGAAELDRKPTAITRADAAIANLVANKHKFSTAGLATVTVVEQAVSDEPAGQRRDCHWQQLRDDRPGARSLRRGDGHHADAQHDLPGLAPRRRQHRNHRRARSQDSTPRFASSCRCSSAIPGKAPARRSSTLSRAASERRRQIKMQLGSGGESQYFPGNYGWLDSPNFGNGGEGANALRDALASVQPTACFVQNGVSQRTGNIDNANKAINIRFDMWDGPFNKTSTNPSYARPRTSARVICPRMRKAATPATSRRPTRTTTSWDRDTAYPDAGGRLGNGDWDFEAYWTTNYGTVIPERLEQHARQPPSRYQVYRHELGAESVETAAVGGQCRRAKGHARVLLRRRRSATIRTGASSTLPSSTAPV